MHKEDSTADTRSPALNQWQKCAFLVLPVCLIVVGTLLGIIRYHETHREPVNYAWPPHFQYYERTYVNRGYYDRSLPDGYELAGETTDIGSSFEREHMEGNVSGYVYINPENDELAYYQHKLWNEAEQGTQPYWKYGYEEDW